MTNSHHNHIENHHPYHLRAYADVHPCYYYYCYYCSNHPWPQRMVYHTITYNI